MARIDWHAGFVPAMKLELIDNEDDLEFHEEEYLESRKQRYDLLIIKVNRDVRIKNEIGAIFNKFNILEYKSPDDILDAGEFYKTLAYVCRYLYERHDHDKYSADAYTMTIVRSSMPNKMISQLKTDGITATETVQGIYELKGNLPFKAQMIVTDRLNTDHVWLRCLTRNGSRQELEGLVSRTRDQQGRHKDLADCVMNTFARANNTLMRKETKEDIGMCEAIEELFADKIEMLQKRADEAVRLADEAQSRADEAENRAKAAEAKLKAAGLM